VRMRETHSALATTVRTLVPIERAVCPDEITVIGKGGRQ